MNAPTVFSCLAKEKVWLNSLISEVTGIPDYVLSGSSEQRLSIDKAVKLSGAANRGTTKSEDTAYCMLGIFDVVRSPQIKA